MGHVFSSSSACYCVPIAADISARTTELLLLLNVRHNDMSLKKIHYEECSHARPRRSQMHKYAQKMEAYIDIHVYHEGIPARVIFYSSKASTRPSHLGAGRCLWDWKNNELTGGAECSGKTLVRDSTDFRQPCVFFYKSIYN